MCVKISFILGTRPEIIKMSPIIRNCYNKSNNNFTIIHTGQHYSYNMDRVFFEELELPFPTYNLDVGSGNHGEQTGKMLSGIENILLNEKPDIVLVQGDTNTVLAGALAAVKLHIKVGHIEAGLRSFDRMMPEEINRILTDHISDLLFTPTNNAKKLLISEGIPHKNIYYTGNTIVDAVYQSLEIAKSKRDILKKLDLESKKYFLVTAHRQENVDDPEKLHGILNGLINIYHEHNLPILFPVHPRTWKRIKEFKLSIPNGTRILEPLGFLEFLQLEANSRLILTDSGGLQEEGCILGVPCVTLRENTERPETLEVGSNMLSGCNPDKILNATNKMLDKGNWKNPFGNGKAGEEILRIIQETVA